MLFSVVLSTYGRGRHIAPTISSVLDQTERSFELIVVGDGCTDETRVTVESFGDERVRWLNLERNSGNQSAPNNAGIAAARGKWIAYIGHDDMWENDHLERLKRLAEEQPEARFLVSGVACHGPPGSNWLIVGGIFDEDAAKFENFFPPCCVAHYAGMTGDIGPWVDPHSTPTGVDAELTERAAAAGIVFASTRRITVHKFGGGQRFLCYLTPGSAEQAECLERMRAGTMTGHDEFVECARAQGRYMSMRMVIPDAFKPGQAFDLLRGRKGLLLPEVTSLGERHVISQTPEPRALDWQLFERDETTYRWSGPNPRPRILIPVTHSGPVRFSVAVGGVAGGRLEEVEVSLDDRKAATTVEDAGDGVQTLSFTTRLDPERYSILAFHTPHMVEHKNSQRGIAVGDIVIEPDRWPVMSRLARAFGKLARRPARRQVEVAAQSSSKE